VRIRLIRPTSGLFLLHNSRHAETELFWDLLLVRVSRALYHVVGAAAWAIQTRQIELR
jgi:hypothetical protein